MQKSRNECKIYNMLFGAFLAIRVNNALLCEPAASLACAGLWLLLYSVLRLLFLSTMPSCVGLLPR